MLRTREPARSQVSQAQERPSLVELAWLFGAFSIIAGLVGTALGGLLTR